MSRLLTGSQRPRKLTGCLLCVIPCKSHRSTAHGGLERKPVKLRANDLADFRLFHFGVWIIACSHWSFRATPGSTARMETSTDRDAVGHTVEPPTERVIDA